jgi:hypothetical protein
MTHPGDAEPDALLDGLDDVTPWEREQLREVLAEVDGGGWGRPGPGPYGGDGDGPWHDQAGTLEEASAALDDTYARNARRLAEDVTDSLDKRPNDEVRLARALDRIADGTYTPPAYFRPAAAPTGRWGYPCGPADDLGGCAARYHRPGCSTLMVTDAGNGSFEDAEAWNAVVRGHLPPAGADADLANPGEPVPWEPDGGFGSFDDLVDPVGEPGSAAPDLHARVLHWMGLAESPPRSRGPGPDVSGLIEELGLR